MRKTILKEVLDHEVNPALGCTEPAAVALACSVAVQAVQDDYGTTKRNIEILKIRVTVSPGIFKNGMGVTIPGTKGEKGNDIAAALGAICGDPNLGLEVFQKVDQDSLEKAKCMKERNMVKVLCNKSWKSLRIEAQVETSLGRGDVIIAGNHTNVVVIMANNKHLPATGTVNDSVVDSALPYKNVLSKMTIADLVDEVQNLDAEDREYIEQGIRINLAISEAGLDLGEVSSQIQCMVKEGFKADDIISSTQILTSAATDARMGGVKIEAMSSGSSGNQGIVAILCPHNVGIANDIDKDTIIESIALSHLINGYIKCFTGDLSPLCGCGLTAGAAASAAIVYQKNKDPNVISLAINNVIADIAGILCDGAKSSCSLKVASSIDSTIRAAHFALQGYGVPGTDGIVGCSAEKTIKNLGIISTEGMSNVDQAVLKISEDKAS